MLNKYLMKELSEKIVESLQRRLLNGESLFSTLE